MSRITTVAALTAAAALAAPAAASAHVTVNPSSAAPGSFSVFTMRVPNERDNKGTNKLVLNLPDGFFSLSYKKVPGWVIRPTKTKLDRPVTVGEFQADEQFARVTFRARPSGVIRPASSRSSRFPSECRTARRATCWCSARSRAIRAATSCAGPARPTPTGRRRG